MRRARNPGWLVSEDGRLLGIECGFEAAAEHEWGVAPLMNLLGMDLLQDGVERRRVRVVPPTLTYTATPSLPLAGLFLAPSLGATPQDYMLRWYKERWNREETLLTAWNERSFGIAVDILDTKAMAFLSELHQAFLSCDIALGRGRGLTFKILSRLDPAEVKEVLQRDLDKKELNKAAEETGIESLLTKAGRKWYALSPARKVTGEVHFFLNPVDQHLYNYGWFSVNELRQWAQGTGPIMKSRGAEAIEEDEKHNLNI